MVDRPRLAVFIDGANLYGMSKGLGFDLDYRRFLREFQGRGYLVRASYYTTIVEDQEYSSLRPLTDWLDYNGYRVVTKPGREFTDAAGRRKVRGSVDVEIAVDALELAPRLDEVVLVSGDGDLRALVEALQRRGVRVTVVSTVSTPSPMIADDLRRQADEFVDLAALIGRVGRDQGERAARATSTVTATASASSGASAASGLEGRYGIRPEDAED